MSSSPKYSEVEVVGEAARSLAQTVEASYQRVVDEWESEMQRRRDERLEREQSQIHATTQRLTTDIQRFENEADAGVIRTELDRLHDRLSRCSATRPNDLSSARSLLRELTGIERALSSSRRRVEAVRLNRALDGVARQVALLEAEIKELDPRDCEQFDRGVLATITQSIAVLDRDVARKRLYQAEENLADLRQRLDAHIQRVRAGQDQRDHDRNAAEHAIAMVTDRYSGLNADSQLARYIADDLQKLQPDLQVLDKLMTTEQFPNVHQQVNRLNSRLDQIACTARSRVEQIEKLKMIKETLISVMTSTRGILLAGCQQGGNEHATLRFNVAEHGTLEVQIGLDGPISFRAEGFKHEQRLTPDGSIERTCDGFVKWFEPYREDARKKGLEIGPQHWDKEPKPKQTHAAGAQTPQHRTARHIRTRSAPR